MSLRRRKGIHHPSSGARLRGHDCVLRVGCAITYKNSGFTFPSREMLGREEGRGGEGETLAIVVLCYRCELLSSSICVLNTFRTRFSSPRAHLHVVGMLRFISDSNQPSLPTPFNSVLASKSVFMAFSTVFHSTNSPDSFSFSDSVLRVLSHDWSFQLYIYLLKSPSALI